MDAVWGEEVECDCPEDQTSFVIRYSVFLTALVIQEGPADDIRY
jgi:hypothetical protein